MAKKDKKKKAAEDGEVVEKKPKKNRDWIFVVFLLLLATGVTIGYRETANMSPSTSHSSTLVFRVEAAEEDVVEGTKEDSELNEVAELGIVGQL